MSKKDLVDADWLELVTADVRAAMAGTFLEDAPIIACSVKSQEGIAELRAELLRLALETRPREFRGAWVATVANINWPSRPGLSVTSQKTGTMARP